MTPFGTTTMEFVVEQLLCEKVGGVEFQLPVIPLKEVDHITFDLKISDASEGAQDITLDLPQLERVSNHSTTFHMEYTDARQQELPQIVRGLYTPDRLPDAGALYTDGKCFEHIFHPSALEPMHKNVVLLVDVSRSMQGERLQAAMFALTTLVDSLTAEDTLTIQTFAFEGTEDLWGMNFATDQEKKDAKEFINSLTVSSHAGDNLFEALGTGLIRAQMAKDKNPNAVTMLVILADGRANVGEWRTSRIARVIWEQNQRVGAKIFSLGFDSSDLDLLRAISIMNGGVTSTLIPGDDIAEQMNTFFESEFGKILLSDVSFGFPNKTVSTQSVFPVLAEGTEIVVRGLLPDDTAANLDATSVQVKANTRDGPQTWHPIPTGDPYRTDMPETNSRCFQSFAHAKINQLLELAHATSIVGEDVIEPLLTLTKPCAQGKLLYDCIREDALKFAIDANLVVSGLTAMTSEDADKCFSVDDEVEVCVDGTSATGTRPGDDDYDGVPGASTSTSHSQSLFVTILMAVLTIICFDAWM